MLSAARRSSFRILAALSLCLRRPDLFGSVAAFDPAIAPTFGNFLGWGNDARNSAAVVVGLC